MLIDEEAPALGVDAEAHPDPRPALALGLVLDARHAVVQLAARARAVRRARLRRRARALPPARAEPLAPVLDARRAAPPDWRAQRDWLARARPRAARLQAALPAQIGVAAVEPVLARRVRRRRRRACPRAPPPCAARCGGMCSTSPAPSSTTCSPSSPSSEAHPPFEDVRELLVLVRVLRHDRALREIDRARSSSARP